MTIHLAARLVWNDRGWDGCICDDPRRNVFCTGQERVREEKKLGVERATDSEFLMKLYVDGDITPKLAHILRTRGYDVVSAHEVGDGDNPALFMGV